MERDAHGVIRLINVSDAEGALALYAPYVRSTSITFECTEPTFDEFTHKIETIRSEYPWVVYEKNGEILGYAYASRHRPKEAYRWPPESTIYLREDIHRKGTGRLLYQTLFSILKLQGYVNVYAGVTQPNEKSNKFHQALGFSELGQFKNIGYKFGRWHDTKWYQLALTEHISDPPLPRPIQEVKDTPEFKEILNTANRILQS